MLKELAGTTLVAVVTPSESIPGQWIGHCLTIDVVTQGTSIAHAFEMLEEAVLLSVEDDLGRGLDPLTRPQAPPECWKIVQDVVRSGVPLGQLENDTVQAALGYMLLLVPVDSLPQLKPHPELIPPPAWQIAALGRSLSSQANC